MNNEFIGGFGPRRPFRRDRRFENNFFPFATGLLLGAAIDGPGFFPRPYPYYQPYPFYQPYPPFFPHRY